MPLQIRGAQVSAATTAPRKTPEAEAPLPLARLLSCPHSKPQTQSHSALLPHLLQIPHRRPHPEYSLDSILSTLASFLGPLCLIQALWYALAWRIVKSF